MSSKEEIKKRWFTDAKPIECHSIGGNLKNTQSSFQVTNTNIGNSKVNKAVSSNVIRQKESKESLLGNARISTKFTSTLSSSSSTNVFSNFSSTCAFTSSNTQNQLNSKNLSPSTRYVSPYRGVSAGPVATYSKIQWPPKSLTYPPMQSSSELLTNSNQVKSTTSSYKPFMNNSAGATVLVTSNLNRPPRSIFEAIPSYSFPQSLSSERGPFTPLTPTAKTTVSISQQPITTAISISNKKKLKGFAIIFNQEKFYEKKMNREGSRQDEDALSRIFSRFGFTVTVKRNLKFSEIQAEVKHLMNKNFKEYGCFLAVILSHGTNDETIFAYDKPFNLNRNFIHPIVTNRTLIEKPKIFIIATCRGDMENLFANYVKVETDAVPFSEQFSTVPCYRDILKCYSTYEGFVSYRNPSKGTLYIQTLCNVLEKKGATSSIDDILKDVNKELTEGKTFNKQVPTVVSTMSSNFCFGDLKQK